MSLPSFIEARERIQSCDCEEVKRLFQTVDLFGLRIGEACGFCYDSEVKAQPTGMLLWASTSSWQVDEDNDEDFILLKRRMMRNLGRTVTEEEILNLKEPAFVLSIITEKRKGFNRQAAIPLNPDYDPYPKGCVQDLLNFILERQKHGPLNRLKKLTKEISEQQGKPLSIVQVLKTDEAKSIIEKHPPVFPFYRQEIWPKAIELFKGFKYPIEQYKKRVGTNPETGKGVYELIPAHQKQFSDHALRHLRSTELKSIYRIKGEMLDKFMGWTKPRGGGSSAMQDRYVLEAWREAGYFPRLLRRRSDEPTNSV